MSPPKARDEAKAVAAKPRNFNPAGAARRGLLQVLLYSPNPPAPRVLLIILLHHPPLLEGKWLHQRLAAELGHGGKESRNSDLEATAQRGQLRLMLYGYNPRAPYIDSCCLLHCLPVSPSHLLAMFLLPCSPLLLSLLSCPAPLLALILALLLSFPFFSHRPKIRCMARRHCQ